LDSYWCIKFASSVFLSKDKSLKVSLHEFCKVMGLPMPHALRLGGKRIAAAPRPAGATGGPEVVISTRATMVPMTAKA
jgi:hypothetical protein